VTEMLKLMVPLATVPHLTTDAHLATCPLATVRRFAAFQSYHSAVYRVTQMVVQLSKKLLRCMDLKIACIKGNMKNK
jgi:hypothetical protein